jgi:hypothetical protein
LNQGAFLIGNCIPAVILLDLVHALGVAKHDCTEGRLRETGILGGTNTSWIASAVISRKVTILGACIKGTIHHRSTRLTGEHFRTIKVIHGQTDRTGIHIRIYNGLWLIKQVDRLG